MREGWQYRSLGDICDAVGGGTPSKRNPVFYEGDIPWATVRDMRNEALSSTEFHISSEAVASSSTNIIPRKNVVIATRVGLGKVCLLEQDTAINQDLRGIIPKTGNLDVRFLFRWFQSIASRIQNEGTGATVKGVKLTFIKSLQLPLPPIAEQKRIAAILDEAFAGIDAAIANTEKNLANARELFESELERLVECAVKECGVARLSEITLSITDGDHMPPPKSDEGIPFITIRNIDKNTREIDFSNTFRVSEKYFLSLKENRKPRTGDILYTVTGSYGIPVLVGDNDRFCFQRHIGLIRPKPEILSEWIEVVLLSNYVRKQVDDGATGTAQKTVSLKVLRSLKMPNQLESDQGRLVERTKLLYSETSRLEGIYSQKLSTLAELKQSLLQKAFTGELTAENMENEAREAMV